MTSDSPIVFFDGICTLCNRWVDFLMRHDSHKRLRFAALQGETAKTAFQDDWDVWLESLVLILPGDQRYFYSDAVIRTLDQLGGGWRLIRALLLVPRFIRDPIYRFVARNRFRWFPKKETCRIPTENEKVVFLP